MAPIDDDNDDTQLNVTMMEEKDENAKVELKFPPLRGTDQGGGDSWLEAEVGSSTGRSHLVKCDMVQICHGTMKPKGPPASLIVLLFRFQPDRRDGDRKRFKWVQILLTFKQIGSSSSGGPEIIKFAPDEEWSIFPSEKTHETSHEAKLAFEGGIPVAKVTPAYTWTKSTKQTIKSFATVAGVKLRKGRNKPRMVRWVLTENKDSKSGIPTHFGAAVLVQRDGTSASGPEQFSVELEISGMVDTVTETHETVKNVGRRLKGNDRKGADKIFDLRYNKRGAIKDEHDLNAEDLMAFVKVATKREWKGDDEQAAALQKSSNETLPETGKTPSGNLQHPETPSVPKAQALQPAPALGPVPPIPSGHSTAPSIAGAAPSAPLVNVVNTPRELPKPVDQPPVYSGPPPAAMDTGSLGLDSKPPGVQPTQPASVPPPEHAKPAVAERGSDGPKHTTSLPPTEPLKLRMEELRDRLATVRIESNLVRRLIKLEEEESKIVQEIMDLEIQYLE